MFKSTEDYYMKNWKDCLKATKKPDNRVAETGPYGQFARKSSRSKPESRCPKFSNVARYLESCRPKFHNAQKYSKNVKKIE